MILMLLRVCSERGMADMVSMAGPFLADEDFVLKAEEGPSWGKINT
ncbi:MAG: hypothetical protein Ct9H90mP8_1260 [Pseudomonadota bacterium]|nr:MAG: hypothetical protein Ct9H90mP8_1260 [Pseudomonadota bacterium]